MGRRSGQRREISSDLAASADLGGDGGGASLPPPLPPADLASPGVTTWGRGNSATGSIGAAGVTVTLRSGLRIPSPSSSLASPSESVRVVRETSPPSTTLNYAIQKEEEEEEKDKEHVLEHPLVSSLPSSSPLSSSPSPSSRYLPARTLRHREDATRLNPKDASQRTPTKGMDARTKTTTTTTKRNQPQPQPQPPPATTTTRTLRRGFGRTYRSAPSQDRLVQPSPALPKPTSVCALDPCGEEPSCHEDPHAPGGFTCFCDDLTKVKPYSSCLSRGLVLSEHPSPKTLAVPVPKERDTVYMVWPMGLTSVLVVAVLMLVLWRRKSLCAWLRHRHREKKPTQSQEAIHKSNSLVAYNFASNPNYYTQGPDAQTVHSLPVHLIRPEQISFIGELGEGCFGKVYKGTYALSSRETLTEGDHAEGGGGGGRGGGGLENQDRGSEGDEGDKMVTQTVAVKVIKESVTAKDEEDFMREVEIMSAFSHPNILTLIGIVAKGSGVAPWMVFEYMPYGDLAELLRSCGSLFYSNHTPVTSLSTSDLLHISIQIASGMEYLSSQHFVHRDLACRNCLVGEDLTVKISDFGMSRDVYTCDYYKIGGSRMLPVRWMAPESIVYGKFTLESDVWSFGVVLWEIYSFGKQPYYGNSNENVLKLIFQGILLSPPDTCPPKVCDVMRRCWATDPSHRLTFPEILAYLKVLLGEGKAGDAITSFMPVTYSQLCVQDEGSGHLDQDLYLVPRRVEPREYLTVLNV